MDSQSIDELSALFDGVCSLQTVPVPSPDPPKEQPKKFKKPMYMPIRGEDNKPYNEIISTLAEECKKINLTYSKEGDGRITSAIKEKEYLDLLVTGLNSRITTEIPKERWWYDIRIGGIPFNLKITSGGTDNAFNKTAIIYTISGKESTKRSMNYNEWFKIIKDGEKKKVRDKRTEYHYIVVDKDTGSVLIKSILDIHAYKSNPSNDMQINWAHEFKHSDYYIDDCEFEDKIKKLLNTVQTSVKQAIENMKDFANADISTL